MDKLGLYIANLMATIVDREEKEFVRKLSFSELQRLNGDIGDFLLKWNDKFNPLPEELREGENERQLNLQFGENKNEQ